MANYCTFSDVEKKIQLMPFTATSNPNQTDVTSFCTDITAMMDARFRAVGIATQITDADLLAVVKPIATDGAGAMTYRSVGNIEDAAACQTLFDNAMKGIEKNPLILSPSVSEKDSSPGGQTGVTQPFKRNVKEW